MEWDARVREIWFSEQLNCVSLVLSDQSVGKQARRPRPTLPITAPWLLLPNQGRITLGKVLGEMNISKAKTQVLQSIAGVFPCNAVLHKWGIVPLAACALCSHPAVPHPVSLLCHQGGQDSGPQQQRAQDVPSDVEGHSGLHYRVGHCSRAGLQDLHQPEDQIIEWQRAWDEVADVHWESDVEQSDPDAVTQQKRSDA